MRDPQRDEAHRGNRHTAEASQLPGPAELVLTASVARRFYLDGRSKVEIAEEFGLSRFKVARVLELARTSGIVRISIEVPTRIDAELSERLRTAYGLRRAVVVTTPEDSGELAHQLGAVAADLLSEIVTAEDVIGLAWGRTLNAMAGELTRLAPCTVVQLNGVLSHLGIEESSVETVRRTSNLAAGRAYPIYAPLILPDAATARALRADPGIAGAFDHFDHLTKAVVAIGAWDARHSTVCQALDSATRSDYAARGVRAEMSAHLFDDAGERVRTDLADRILTITTEQLRRIPDVIAVAGGAGKAEAIGTVLRSGLVSSLVTDSTAARRLVG